MFGITKQKNNLEKMVYPKKYRLTFFGYTTYFDWKFLISLFLLMMISITFYAFFIKLEIDSFINRDFSDEVELEEVDDINIGYYQKVLNNVQNIKN